MRREKRKRWCLVYGCLQQTSSVDTRSPNRNATAHKGALLWLVIDGTCTIVLHLPSSLPLLHLPFVVLELISCVEPLFAQKSGSNGHRFHAVLLSIRTEQSSFPLVVTAFSAGTTRVQLCATRKICRGISIISHPSTSSYTFHKLWTLLIPQINTHYNHVHPRQRRCLDGRRLRYHAQCYADTPNHSKCASFAADP